MMRTRMVIALALLGMPAMALGEPAGLPPSPSAIPPQPYGWLEGNWSGSGNMMGKASTATLSAGPALRGRFLELRWRVEGVVPGGYEGRGLYRQPKEPGSEWVGSWFDSYGMTRPLTAMAGTGTFTVSWGTEATERGQSLYRLDGDELVVEDKVMRGGTLNVFATHRLKRVG